MFQLAHIASGIRYSHAGFLSKASDFIKAERKLISHTFSGAVISYLNSRSERYLEKHQDSKANIYFELSIID